MKVLKQFKGEDHWEEISLDEALERLEGGYKEGAIIPMLKEGATLETPFSFYKLNMEAAD
jgi:hypothetical protein